MQKKWLKIGVLSLSLAGATPLVLHAQYRDRDWGYDRDHRYDRDSGMERQPLDFRDLPHPVRESVRRSGWHRDVVSSERIISNGILTYQVVVRNRHGDYIIMRLRPDGEIIGQNNVGREGYNRISFESVPRSVQRTISGEMRGRHIDYIDQVKRDGRTYYVADLGDGRVLQVDDNGRVVQQPLLLSVRNDRDRDRDLDASGWYDEDHRWQTVPFNSLPEPVKNTVGQEIGQQRVTDVIRTTHNGRTIYRVHVEGANGRAQVLRVDQDGRLLSTRNTTEPGRTPVNYNTLPGPVKSTLSQESQGGSIQRIYQVTRNGRTWFVARIDQGDGVRFVRIDSNGNLLQSRSRQ